MLKTAAIFEERGFVKVMERDGIFTRFVSLKKRNPLRIPDANQDYL